MMPVKKGSLAPVAVETEPYPGYPTDLQAQLMMLLTQVSGVSQITENIFNNRFRHALELNRLGADIRIKGNIAEIHGKTALSGTTIRASDLRASAALVMGALAATGETVIENAYQLFRGYEQLPEKLKALGADIHII
jgi:UDP-N-acetylglucosamine 1-carboxyvinyltransferase